MYRGARLVVPGQLAGAVFKVQIDIGMGDATVPAPGMEELASILDLPATRLRVYRRETVIAEKLEALVVLGLTTSRMKDLYDLDLLGRRYEYDAQLVEAVWATFDRRGTAIPGRLPEGLSDAFAADSTKQVQWRAFLRKSGAAEQAELGEVVRRLSEWLWPVLHQAAEFGAQAQDSNCESGH